MHWEEIIALYRRSETGSMAGGCCFGYNAEMPVKTLPRVEKRRGRRELAKRWRARPQPESQLIEDEPGDDLPILIYFDQDSEELGESEAVEEVESALTDYLATYGLEVGEREEIPGSLTIKLKAFGGLSVEFEMRLDLLSWLSRGKAGKKDIPPRRKSALERFEATIKKHNSLISIGSLVIAVVSLIHGGNPPKPEEPPVQQPQYIYVLQEKEIVFVEVDREFADAVHSGRVTVPQLKSVIAKEAKSIAK